MYKDIDKYNNKEYNDYCIEVSINKLEEVINYLKEKKLITSYMGTTSVGTWQITIPNEKITDEVKELIRLQEKKHPQRLMNSDGSLTIDIFPNCIYGDANEEILKKAGIDKLNKNEIILVNSRRLQDSKFGDEVPITKYTAGENIVVQESTTEKRKIKIVSVIDNIEPYIINDRNIIVIVNQEMVRDYFYNGGLDDRVKLFLSTEKPYEIDKMANKLEIHGVNSYAYNLSDISKKNVMEVAVYTFVIFITLLTVINIANIISSNINSRKKEIAMLKSIGMSEKQINKMLFLEGLFYGIDSLIIGLFISCIILYIIYLKMIDIRIYKFTISYINIIISIVIMYIAIFTTIALTKRKLKNKNIIEEIRQEYT